MQVFLCIHYGFLVACQTFMLLYGRFPFLCQTLRYILEWSRLDKQKPPIEYHGRAFTFKGTHYFTACLILDDKDYQLGSPKAINDSVLKK